MLVYSKDHHKYVSVKEEYDTYYVVFTDNACTQTARVSKKNTLTVAEVK